MRGSPGARPLCASRLTDLPRHMESHSFGCREAESDFGKGVLTTLLSSACSRSIPGSGVRRLPHGAVLEDHHAVPTHRCWTRDAVSVLPSEVDTQAGHWMHTFKKLAGVMLILTACWLLGGWNLAIGVLATVFYAGGLKRSRKL